MDHSSKQIIKNTLIHRLHSLEDDQAFLKRRAAKAWRDSIPNTHEGDTAFVLLNYYKDELREITRKLTKIRKALKEIKHA